MTKNNDVNSRRNFLKKTALSVAAISTVAPVAALADDPAITEHAEWGTILGKKVSADGGYGVPSPYEHNVVRRTTPLLASGDEYASVAMCPIHETDGIITPNGLFFNRSHGGTCIIDPNKFRLMIHGLVKRPLVLTLDEIKKYPRESRIYFIECPANGSTDWRGPQFNSIQFLKGMMSSAEWTGVRLKTIMDDLGLKPEAEWMLAEGSDNSEMGRTIPVQKVLDDAMLVWAQNGEALRPDQGYPLRLLVPGWEGNLQVKWLKRLEFATKPWHSKEETSKYTMTQPDGRAIRFFWPMEVNSIITTPCPEKGWEHVKVGDLLEIEGIAWTGQGTILGVDISLDGGKNWVEASLKGLVLPKSWTRFSYMYRWTGKEIHIASRAYDDAKNVQPTIDEETAVVGVESVYHRNPICTWQVTSTGKVNNVHFRKFKA
jgi:sulfane dehydrogenase subunit SoxC